MFQFVVDTEQYAGNFERDMTAYMTGVIGECGVGDEEADIFREEEPDSDFENLLAQVPDEHGNARPVKIVPTPGWFNDGMGGHFREGQEEEALAHYREECIKYDKTSPGFSKDKITKPLTKYPAYLSVGIFMHRRPTAEEVALFKRRAREFCEHQAAQEGWRKKDIKITGFRLVETKSTETSMTL